MQQIDSHNHLSADRIVQLWKWKWLSELKAIDFPNNNIPPSHGRVSLTTVRAAGWAALTTCKYSQLSSLVGPFERFPTFVDRPDIFSSLKFSIYNMHNWEHLNLGLTEYQQRSWLSSQPVADEKILSHPNYPLLHGHLGPGLQLANAINPPEANRWRPPGHQGGGGEGCDGSKGVGEPLLAQCWEEPQFDHRPSWRCCELQSFMLQLALDLDSDVPGIVQLMV